MGQVTDNEVKCSYNFKQLRRHAGKQMIINPIKCIVFFFKTQLMCSQLVTRSNLERPNKKMCPLVNKDLII